MKVKKSPKISACLTLLLVFITVIGCSDRDDRQFEQLTAPDDSKVSSLILDSAQDLDTVAIIKGDGRKFTTLADPLKWPTCMPDFTFPTAYGQAWKITCGYGCYKHKYTRYPSAGFYSVDLVRVYAETRGSCVTACARGIVVYADKTMAGYGWCVIIDHDYGHTGAGYKSIVAHLQSDPRDFVKVGDDVRAGTILGYCGSSGTESDHIHFGIWRNNTSVPLNGISGYDILDQGGIYYSHSWPVQPPQGFCVCR